MSCQRHSLRRGGRCESEQGLFDGMPAAYLRSRLLPLCLLPSTQMEQVSEIVRADEEFPGHDWQPVVKQNCTGFDAACHSILTQLSTTTIRRLPVVKSVSVV